VVCSEGDPVTQSAVLAIEKTATTSWTRDWSWTIEKSTSTPKITLGLGQTGTASYNVTVNGLATDSDFEVAGSITVSNAGTGSADINAPSDNLPTAVVTCPDGVVFPYRLDPGATLTCTYTAIVATRDAGENIATVTGVGVGGADINSPAASEPVPFSFSDTPTTETKKCVDVSDVFNSGSPVALGTVCGNADGSATTKAFSYTNTIPASTAAQCGQTPSFSNTAFVKDGDVVLDDASATVAVMYMCGCTPGYWSNTRRPYPAGLSISSILSAAPAFNTGAVTWGVYATNLRRNPPSPLNTFGDAWTWSSGSTLAQATQQAMRHASAALLNSYAVAGFEFTTQQVRDRASAILTSTDRDFVLMAKDELAAANERGCPLPNR
jgi:hypothetical protein